jgi:putative spermidine/putrescine transport system ATP-binding protein
MNVCANDEFIVKVPNIQRNLTLAEGDHVKVGWHIEDCRALDA